MKEDVDTKISNLEADRNYYFQHAKEIMTSLEEYNEEDVDGILSDLNDAQSMNDRIQVLREVYR